VTAPELHVAGDPDNSLNYELPSKPSFHKELPVKSQKFRESRYSRWAAKKGGLPMVRCSWPKPFWAMVAPAQLLSPILKRRGAGGNGVSGLWGATIPKFH
jgi:hypothetical protein